MSLEHDYNVNEGVVLGNFYISGEYQVHPISINRDPFKYTLPSRVVPDLSPLYSYAFLFSLRSSHPKFFKLSHIQLYSYV